MDFVYWLLPVGEVLLRPRLQRHILRVLDQPVPRGWLPKRIVAERGTTVVGQTSTEITALEQRVERLEADARHQVAGVSQALPLPARELAQQAEQSLSRFSWQ